MIKLTNTVVIIKEMAFNVKFFATNILIYFSCIFLLPVIHARLPKTPIVNCTTSPGQLLYCSDCFTAVLCSQNLTFPCEKDKACLNDGLNAYCTDVTSVPECECLVIPSIIADPYDDQKYINCTVGGPVVQTCPDGAVFDPDQGNCRSCPSIEYILTPINCTHYQANNTCEILILECPINQFFDEEKNNCVDYEPFTCAGKLPGLYPDSHNCSVFHYCDGAGVEPGDPFTCPTGSVFNGTSCVPQDPTFKCPCAPVIPKYVVCNTGTEIYPTTNCKIYYTCVEVSTGVYGPQLNECPPGLLFNPQLMECVPPILNPICNSIDKF